MASDVRLMLGDCLDRMGEIDNGSVDAVITDPPYPEIDRPYGRMTEPEWNEMIRSVVAHVRRILKPTGSAVFVLQPNSERVGRIRPWLWEFMAWICRDWNMVQDAWWWNHNATPMTKNDPNLLRASVKACVWAGERDCYRDGISVLWTESDANKAERRAGRLLGSDLEYGCGGKTTIRERQARTACVAKGGVTAFNLLPIGTGEAAGEYRHPARTPSVLADWWVRYISPPEGVICDPFMGSGTMGLAALNRGRSFIGVERDPGYFDIASKRIAEAQAATPLLTG